MFKGIRSFFLGFVILVLASSIYGVFQPTPLIYDAIEYEFAAKNLYHHNTLYSGDFEHPIDFRLYSKRTIGYPIFQIFQANNKILIILAQILLLILNFIVGLNILKSLNINTLGYKIFCWFMLFTPVLILHSQLYLADLILMTCITILGSIFLGSNIGHRTKVFMVSALMILAVLMKPVMLPSLILLILAFVYYAIKKQQFHFSLLAPIIVVLLLSAINQNKSGIFEYSSIGTINIAQYNAKLTIANKYGYDSAQQFSNSEIYQIPRSKEAYAIYKDNLNRVGFSAINDNLISYFKVHTLGAFKMIFDPGRFEIYTFFGEPTSDISLTELLYAKKWDKLTTHLKTNKPLMLFYSLLLIISVFKLFGGLFTVSKFNKKLLILIGICLYFIALAGPIGAARFFVPCTLLFGVLVSVGWTNILDLFQKRSKS